MVCARRASGMRLKCGYCAVMCFCRARSVVITRAPILVSRPWWFRYDSIQHRLGRHCPCAVRSYSYPGSRGSQGYRRRFTWLPVRNHGLYVLSTPFRCPAHIFMCSAHLFMCSAHIFSAQNTSLCAQHTFFMCSAHLFMWVFRAVSHVSGFRGEAFRDRARRARHDFLARAIPRGST